MTAEALLLVGALGVLTAFVERRDGWRYAHLAERTARLEERLGALEARTNDGQPEPAPTAPWWAPWRRRP